MRTRRLLGGGGGRTVGAPSGEGRDKGQGDDDMMDEDGRAAPPPPRRNTERHHRVTVAPPSARQRDRMGSELARARGGGLGTRTKPRRGGSGRRGGR